MKSIFKYKLYYKENKLVLPEDAHVLHVGVQDNSVCIWIQVDTEAPMEDRTFYVCGTGWDMTEIFKEEDGYWYAHMGTVQAGEFVWHVYEIWDTGPTMLKVEE